MISRITTRLLMTVGVWFSLTICILQGPLKCSPIVIRISDRRFLAEDVLRPQVIISGAIHGNERVVSIQKYSNYQWICLSKKHCCKLYFNIINIIGLTEYHSELVLFFTFLAYSFSSIPRNSSYHDVILQGPQASVFLAELLVWSAMCEIHKSEKHCTLLGIELIWY